MQNLRVNDFYLNNFLRVLFLFTIFLITNLSVFAQGSLPDLAVTNISVNQQNQVVVAVRNIGRGIVPNTVWTVRNSSSPVISIRVNGQNWGGIAIWSGDPDKKLQPVNGVATFVFNYRLQAETRIEAIADSNNNLSESNKQNNSLTKTLRPISGSQPNANPSNTAKGSFFSNTPDFNLNKIRTIYTMQEHVQWVSITQEAAVMKPLLDNGFQILGNQINSAGGVWGERLRGYVATKDNVIVIVFRGTGGGEWRFAQTFVNAVITDANVSKTKHSFFLSSSALTQAQNEALVHKGFNEAYNLLRPQILNALRGQNGKQLYVFGHSLGGALATLCALDMGINYRNQFSSITHIASGSPRVGDERFRNVFERFIPNNLRFTLNHDPVPTIPNFTPTLSGLQRANKFQHVGRLLTIGKDDGVILKPYDIDVKFNARQLSFHDKDDYLKAAGHLLQRVRNNSAVISQGNKIIVDSGNAEREMADKYIK